MIQPTAPGWYWVERKDNNFVYEGHFEVVHVLQGEDRLYVDGFGEMTLDEIGYGYQAVAPPVWE
jgi:hypothetical protein